MKTYAGYEAHEYANIFPMIQGAEFDELCQNIEEQGLLEPVWLYQGKILDGRNRAEACECTGTTLETREYTGDDPIGFVLSLNLHRRHLNSAQRAFLATELEPLYAAEAKKRQVRKPVDSVSQRIEQQNSTKASEQAARAVGGTNRQYVSDAKKIKEIAPDIADATRSGKLNMPDAKKVAKLEPEKRQQVMAKVEAGEKATDAIRDVNRQEIKNNLESIESREAKALEGVFDVLVIDPPWPMKKIERDERPNQSEFDYPVMTEDELAAMDIPAADDCHVWVWTTQKFLPMALRLLNAWGLKYVCNFVWHKPGGFQPVGLPQYNCEFALYARRGSPKFIDTKAFPVCFDAPRGKHSEKPEMFYEVVRRVTAGRRADIFNRRKIDGFERWGNEA